MSDDDLNTLYKVIYGTNGQPGLKTRVALVEEKLKSFIRIGGAIFVVVVANLVIGIMEKVI